MIREIWMDRQDFHRVQSVEKPMPALTPGQICAKITRFALTANNVSYALSGEAIGYWKFFPAADEWGIVPVWGFAEICDSAHPDLPVGERLWGYFPMASHVVMEPGDVSDRQFTDHAACRQPLPALYNQYARRAAEHPSLAGMEDLRALLFPLFATSFGLYDFLIDNAFFGADQVMIGSASSKTALGLAQLLAADSDAPDVVGVTSPGNRAFCDDLGYYDRLLGYGDEGHEDPSRKTVFIDMSGNSALAGTLHRHFADNLVSSWRVGATHWAGQERLPRDLPGAKSQFFFAPAHFAKRDAEWGPGAMWRKASAACVTIAQEFAPHLSVEHHQGGADCLTIWKQLLENQIAPNRGIIMTL